MQAATTAIAVSAASLLPTSSTTCSFICSENSAAIRWHQPKSNPPMLVKTSWRHKFLRRERSRNSLSIVHSGERQPRATQNPTTVIVLQHSNEVGRRSATAPLLFDGGDESGDDISHHLSAKRWTWSGRKDNEKIQRLIEEIEKYDGIVPALLWTGTGAGQSIDETDPATQNRRSYIVLDGTWKEARAMFRKMPFLQRLPRISFEGGRWETQYSLRSDYSNWRKRFSEANVSSDADGSDLLCTAESVAALLDLSGNEEGGDIIRHRLELFQDGY